MSHGRVAVDWEELELTLTWSSEEGSWLDVTTGQVVGCVDGEEDSISEDDVEAGVMAGRLIAIDPLPSTLR